MKLRFAPEVARLVSERQWHKTQKLTAREDGGVDLALKVGLAPDLEAWILGWGGQVEVLEPARLRGRIRSAAEQMAGKKQLTHRFAC